MELRPSSRQICSSRDLGKKQHVDIQAAMIRPHLLNKVAKTPLQYAPNINASDFSLQTRT